MSQLGRLHEILKDPAAVYVRDFVQAVAAKLEQGTSILDAGAGQCTYKRYFRHCRYTSVDNAVGDHDWDYSKLDIVAPLHALPVADGSFDAILCTEVLEHLDDPLRCLTEMARVLRPSGRLYLTVPFFHHEHQVPNDYFRYTSFGLRFLLERAGFQSDAIQVERTAGGIFMRWAYELTSLFGVFPGLRIGRGKKGARDWLLLPFKATFLVSLRLLQLVLIALDPLDKSQVATFGWNVSATRKSSDKSEPA